MKKTIMHHPNYSPTLIRRHACEALIDMIAMTADLVSSRGHLLYDGLYPSDTAYRSACYRLHKAGVIAYRRSDGRTPVLVLTPKGNRRVSAALQKKQPWPKKWSGIWQLLMFDVPEADRRYRNELRAFMVEKRMGCLQKSVWVTPHDIRPEYDDLVKAAAIDDFAYLMECQTVLRRSPQDIVLSAWNMEQLQRAQSWYLRVYEEKLERVLKGPLHVEKLTQVLREELSAYQSVMRDDPYLPRPLWPSGYVGERAWQFHWRFVRAIGERL